MQTVIFENIFYIENGYVTVYRFLKNKKKFEYLKRDGLKSYPITDDFWDWWKKASDYVDGNDKVDFCFIYDSENSIVSNIFLNEANIVKDNSCWSKQAIKDFFVAMVKFTHIELALPNGRILKFDKDSQLFGGKLNVPKKFFTNIRIEDKTTRLNSIKGEISPFALYFQELRRREKEI